MALASGHVSSPGDTQPGMTCQGHYPTRRLYDGTGCTKEKEALDSSQEQRETTRWKEQDLHHQGNPVLPTKKDSTRHVTCTSKNDKGRSTWNKSFAPYEKGSDRAETHSEGGDRPLIASQSHDPMTTTALQRRAHPGPTTLTTRLP